MMNDGNGGDGIFNANALLLHETVNAISAMNCTGCAKRK